MNFEDQLGRDLKVLGDSQQMPTGSNLDLIGRTVATRRRRTTGAGMAVGAAALGLAAFFGAGVLGNDTAPVQTVDNNGNVVSDIADTPETDTSDDDESGAGATAGSSAQSAPVAGDAVANSADPNPADPNPADPNPADIVYDVIVGADGEFVSIGADSDQRLVIERSADGEVWTSVPAVGLPAKAFVTYFTQLQTGDFIAVVDNEGAFRTAHSTDLTTWSLTDIQGLPAASDPANTINIGGVNLVDGPAGVLITATILEFNDGEVLDVPTVDVDCPDGEACAVPAPAGFEEPMPTSIAALSTDGGRSFTSTALPELVEAAAVVRDGRFFVEGTTPNGTSIALSSDDGLTWSDEPAPSTRSFVNPTTTTTAPDGTSWRAVWAGASSDAAPDSPQCCSIERSTDGGATWTPTADSTVWGVDDSLFLTHIEAGMGGLVASGFLASEGPEADVLSALVNPPEETIVPVGDYSLAFDQVTQFAQLPSVGVLDADGAVLTQAEFGADMVECCRSGVLTVVLDDGTRLETTVDEIRQASGNEPFIAIEKEGWLFQIDFPLNAAAFLSLEKVDGSYSDAWHVSVLDGVVGQGDEGITEGPDEELIFTNPETGEHLVTITAAEGEAAMSDADPDGLVLGSDVATPSAPPDVVFFHSFDGISWTQIDSEVDGEFASVLAVGDDELILAEFGPLGEVSRVRVPLPPRG